MWLVKKWELWKAKRVLAAINTQKVISAKIDKADFQQKLAELKFEYKAIAHDVRKKVEAEYEKRKDAPETIKTPTDEKEAAATNLLLAIKGTEEFIEKKKAEAHYYEERITKIKSL